MQVSLLLVICLLAVVARLTAGNALLRAEDPQAVEKRTRDAEALRSLILTRAIDFRQNVKDRIMTSRRMGGGDHHHDDHMEGDHHHHHDDMDEGDGGHDGHDGHGDHDGDHEGGHMDAQAGGLLGGALGGVTGGGTGTGAVYVDFSVHNNFDCGAEVILRTVVGTNICMALHTSTGASSSAFSLNSLVLAVTTFADTLCKTVMQVIPIDALGSLLNRCVAGVSVAVSTSVPAPPSGAGELVSEYVSSQGCTNNQPIQQLWVSTNHLGNILDLGLPIDDIVGTLVDLLGNPTTCLNVLLDEASIVGLVYNASVYYTVSSTV
jgi:hypothetical protein